MFNLPFKYFKVCITFLLFLTTKTMVSQAKKIDSLKEVALNETMPDTLRLKAKLDIIDYIYLKQLDTLLPLSKEVIKEVNLKIKKGQNTNNYNIFKLKAFDNLGYYFRQKENQDSAIFYYEKAILIATKLKDVKKISSICLLYTSDAADD